MKVLQIIFKFFGVHGRVRGQKLVWYFYFSLSTYLLIYFIYLFFEDLCTSYFSFLSNFRYYSFLIKVFFKDYLFQFPVFLFFCVTFSHWENSIFDRNYTHYFCRKPARVTVATTNVLLRTNGAMIILHLIWDKMIPLLIDKINNTNLN